MNLTNNTISLEAAKKTGKRFVRSLEYELIANLALQQYVQQDKPLFELLLSIPLTERIPGLIREYGLKRMHKLIKLILQEFCYSVALPKSKKLTETRISACACDLILAAEEDQLSLEDLIVFFELAKKGAYGKFKGMLTHYSVMQMLEGFQQDRFNAYVEMKIRKEAEQKHLGPGDRTSPEPTAIRHLFEKNEESIVPMRKIS
ncbi:MAG TPA: hypothetical protein VFS22_07530 [Flavisolibacter sp.]|nr:hypothetical protein [Flavisolibacter sp.]